MSALFDLAIARWREVRADFELILESSYARAVDDCAGVLLNTRGRAAFPLTTRTPAAGVDAYSLFYGPQVRVRAYASDELKAWFDEHGRLTFAQFEREHARELADLRS